MTACTTKHNNQPRTHNQYKGSGDGDNDDGGYGNGNGGGGGGIGDIKVVDRWYIRIFKDEILRLYYIYVVIVDS